MKTLTITLHDTDNCGSSLQAYALQHFLARHHIDNEIVDYVPRYIRYNGSVLRSVAKKMLFPLSSIRTLCKFRRFKKRYLHVTSQKYTTVEALERAHLCADAFITGSDQLWNDTFMCGRDPAYYLSFAENTKLAYAVSLGKEAVGSESKQRIAAYVSDYRWVSVREPSSVSIVSDAAQVPTMYVCDPVFLNSKEDYSAIAQSVRVPSKYILVYLAQYVDRAAMDQMLDVLKDQLHCQTILIGTCVKKCHCDIHLPSVSPTEFLYLIQHAEYVVSNSFHATMFSLIFEKQFATLLPRENGTRITSVLDQVGLRQHGLTEPQLVDHYISEEEYKNVSSVLQNFAVQSGAALLQQLQN